MRRTVCALAVLLGAGGLLGAGAWPASAATGSCALTNYTFTGNFNVLSGSAAFHLYATGSTCVGAPGVTVNIDFNSVGPWSCVGGAALGHGSITPANGFGRQVSAGLVNTGGEYSIAIYGTASQAAGQITTLPIACELGQTQTTIGGPGTLTFNSA